MLLRPLVARAQVHSDRIDIALAAGRMVDALLSEAGRNREDDRQGDDANGDSETLRLSITTELQRAGKEMRFVVAGAAIAIPPDASRVRLLTRAQAPADRLEPEPHVGGGGRAENMGAP